MVAGEGLAALFESAGATVVRGGPGRRASTAELLTGLRAARARDIVVLPNDADSLAVAEAAAAKARDEGLRVAVIPTRASVQALAALAVHDLEPPVRGRRGRHDRGGRALPARRRDGGGPRGRDHGRRLPARETCSGSSTATSR